MTLLADTFYLGANAKVQAIRFALCLALGLASGIIALLYLRKARPVERALTDFFATVCIGGLFIVCLEFFLDGKFELYGLTAFVLGILPIPIITRKIIARKQTSHPSGDSNMSSSDGKQALENETYTSHPSGVKKTVDKNFSYDESENDNSYEYEADGYEYPEDEENKKADSAN